MQKENLTAVEIKVYPIAVKADLSSNSTKIVIGVVVLVANAIKIIKKLIVFIKYKASKLEVFGVTITITIAKRVRKGVKIIRQ